MRGTNQQAIMGYVCWFRDEADVTASTRLR